MQFNIVLVAPSRAENVGAAARAMKTMGITSLRLVNSEVHLQPAAHWVAHGAQEILHNTRCFSSLEDALQGMDLVVASTARLRGKFHSYFTPKELFQQLEEKQNWCGQVALVFGCEESGLSNQQLELADLLTTIPMENSYPSLNLAQTVMIYCYELSPLHLLYQDNKEQLLPDGSQLQVLRQRVEQLLARLSVQQDRKLTEWTQQRLGMVTQRDMAMLHTLLNDLERHLSQ